MHGLRGLICALMLAEVLRSKRRVFAVFNSANCVVGGLAQSLKLHVAQNILFSHSGGSW